jgi:glycosyltransferase involved in cell wall biosynthesis
MKVVDERSGVRAVESEQATQLSPRSCGVTHVTSRYPPDLGGMERVVQELSEALAGQLGSQVEVTTGARRGHWGTFHEGPLLVRRLRSFDALVTPVIPGLAWELLRRPRPRLFHVHVAHAGTPEVVALVAWLRGVPFIAHVHIDASPTTWLGHLLGTYQKFVLSKVLKRAAMVLVPTDSYRTLLLTKYRLDPARVRVLSNGTNMAKREATEAPLPLLDACVRLVSVGRVAKEKNLPLLIDAVDALVKNQDLDLQLEIVGDGPARDEVAQYIEDLGLGSRVHLVGRRGGDDLAASYDHADLFVMTSLSESFGTVLVEAMARGVPVIAPNISGVRDVVIDGETGLLIDHDVTSLCHAVVRIVDEPGLREHLIEGARAQAHRFEWPEIAIECAQLYDEVLASSPQASS